MRRFILFLFLMTIGGVVVYFFYPNFNLNLPETQRTFDELIQKFEEKISLPPPLRAKEEAPESFLNQTGVIQWTNIQRKNFGLPPLKENSELNLSAKKKAQDMIARQYFAHSSPSGEGVTDLAVAAGYKFIAIGENLALGNFENDQALVQAWMDSPGHRENILSSKYQEIGVAVLPGVFEGENTWFAVQHFGRPLSSCPQPSKELAAKIEENKVQLTQLEIKLNSLQSEIRKPGARREPDYNQKVEQYNSLVSQYNELSQETKNLVNQYNNQVLLFNQCAT